MMLNQQTIIQQSFPICPSCQTSCVSSPSSIIIFNQVYHDTCFICEDCKISLKNTKHYLLVQQQKKKILLCESHYTERTATNECSACVTATDQYEFRGQTYCRYHYSQIPETHCTGCDQAILKQFVEHKDMSNQIWHPECYMIFKFWKVKLSLSLPKTKGELSMEQYMEIQTKMEDKVNRVWTDLSSFEESSANCISDMLLYVAAGSHTEAIRMVHQFIMHLGALFSALDLIQIQFEQRRQEFGCQKDAILLCKQLNLLFRLISEPNDAITQELLQLITGLAQQLKSLIRAGLSASLYLEREFGLVAIHQFLSQLLELQRKRVWISGRYWFNDTPPPNSVAISNICQRCQAAIMDTDCYQWQQYKWHPDCFVCRTCSMPLDELTSLMISNAAYCSSCSQEDGPAASYVSMLAQQIDQLKASLSKSTRRHTRSDENQGFTSSHPKRQRSILSILGTPRPERKPSVVLNNMKNIRKEENRTTTIQRGNLLTRSLRRTFSQPTSPRPTATVSSVSDPSSATSFHQIFDPTRPKTELSYMPTLTGVQDYIVRHAAVIAIQPLIVPPFSLNELIRLVETKGQPKKNLSASMLWGRLVTHIKFAPSTPALNQTSNMTKTFGIALSTVAKRDHESELASQGATLCDFGNPLLNACFSNNTIVPRFVKSCISIILRSDVSIEGVFRKNGNIRELKQLADAIDNKPDEIDSLLCNENIIQLAALLKRYLRELPEPLLTHTLYPLFMRCNQMTEPNREHALHLVCCLMPKANRDTMIMIFACLNWVSRFNQTNKMDVANLARVIAPSVFYERSTDCLAEYRHNAQQGEITIIETLIQNINQFSTVPSDLTILTMNDIHQDISHLKSRYFVYHYSKLLSETQDGMKDVKLPLQSKKHHFGLPTRNRNSMNHGRQRRASWMPGLYQNKK
ncbi:hypothetical protein EDC96DRAFT_526770 [Choanephora cucurbitarum]|nr:hypothetical protein EDC96DRAFT_526770 [Choanephora cucurbitarum]